MKTFLEQTGIEEAPLVMADNDIAKSIAVKLIPVITAALKKGDVEFVNNLARHVKYKVSKDKQAKGKTYRYDLK
tara:strand:+ start:205 stop:426 length:222 start_codon:yes stop_codon:yes gene_type:complete